MPRLPVTGSSIARNNRTSWAELAVLLVLVALLVFILLPMLCQVPCRETPPSCQRNLRQLALICLMYANETPGRFYPPLQQPCSATAQEPLRFPDTMTLSLSTVYPEYATDITVFLCPSRTDLTTSRLRAALEAQRAHDHPLDPCVVSPTSYMYYPWRLTPAMLMPTDDPGPTPNATNGISRTALGEALQTLARAISAAPGNGPHNAFDGDLIVGSHVVPRIRGNPEVGASSDDRTVVVMQDRPVKGTTSAVPLEFPDHSGRQGANVLFLDGHVEFMQYPGAWPLCQDWQNLLREVADKTNTE